MGSLPGFSDGSIAWAKVLRYLPDAATMPKLFVEYVGMGDSDKPRDYAYSTADRTDLVEAIRRHLEREEVSRTDPNFVKRCERVIKHVKANIERRTPLLLKRLDQAESVFR